ncbi:MAG: glycosyltransferase family 39 protein [Actinobacteria bacterium]|nr:glycosyltransferase family 39 protein [Actinomycetota bacterium]
MVPRGADRRGVDRRGVDRRGIDRRGVDRRFLLGLAAVTVAALSWRVVYTLLAHRGDRNLFDEGDAFFYGPVASNLAKGHWFTNPFTGAPAADHPPVTVLLLSLPARLLPDSVLALRLTMSVVGSLAVAAIGWLGRALGGARLGIAAAIVAAINPNLWMNDAVVMSEAPSALLIALTLWAGYRLAARPSLARAAALGALTGLTVLVRAEMALLLPFMVLPLALGARQLRWSARLGRAALAGAVAVAVVLPWSLSMAARFRDPVLISTNDGDTLWGANCPVTYDTGLVGGWALGCVLGQRSGPAGSPEGRMSAEAATLVRARGCRAKSLDKSEASTCERRLAVSYARRHLERLPVVVVARQGRTWGFWRPDQMAYANQGEGRPNWASWTGFGFLWATTPLAVAGAVRLRRRGARLTPLLACLAVVVTIVTLFYGIPRFRLPWDVASTVLVAAALVGAAARSPDLNARSDAA